MDRLTDCLVKISGSTAIHTFKGFQGSTGWVLSRKPPMSASPILQAAAIEVVGGEHADLRVHAVLHAQHLHRAAALLQPLEEGSLQLQLLAAL